MSKPDLDEIDRAILYALQDDARHNTNAQISEQVDVSASTVGKRISELEALGIVQGYRPEIDYERAGFPLEVLFVCTAPVGTRESLVKAALELDGVVNVRELMTGQDNVHIQVTGASNEDITAIAHMIDELGYTINDEILMREEYYRPSAHFVAEPE